MNYFNLISKKKCNSAFEINNAETVNKTKKI
jgi:hypothetical protein